MQSLDRRTLSASATFDAVVERAESSPYDWVVIEVSTTGAIRCAIDGKGYARCLWRVDGTDGLLFSNEAFWIRASEPARHEEIKPFEILTFKNFQTISSSVRSLARTESEDLGGSDWEVRLKSALRNATATLCQDRTVAILLSGGIDSSALAAAAAKAVKPSNIRLVHASWPCGCREFETSHARATARMLGLPLTIIDLSKTPLVSASSLRRDVGRHPWLAWWQEVQRVVGNEAELALHGLAGEWFGGDSVALLFQGHLATLHTRAWRRAIRLTSPRELLRAATRGAGPTKLLCDYPWTDAPGKTFLLANPFAGKATPSFCPYLDQRVARLAAASTATSQRVSKALLREAFASDLPSKVVNKQRVGTALIEIERHIPHSFRHLSVQSAARESCRMTEEHLQLVWPFPGSPPRSLLPPVTPKVTR